MLLTKEQYNLIKCIKDNQDFDIISNENTLRYLSKLELIRYTNFTSRGLHFNIPCDYIITEKGKTALAEYEAQQRDENREENALKISEEANNRARQANKISILSIILSGFFSIMAITASVLISLFIK